MHHHFKKVNLPSGENYEKDLPEGAGIKPPGNNMSLGGFLDLVMTNRSRNKLRYSSQDFCCT
jgi:hypothetical protein